MTAEAVRDAFFREDDPSFEPEWSPLGELPNRLPSAPSLPETMIPDGLRPWILDIADRLAVPPEMPTVAAIVAAGGLVGRQLALKPEQFDDWQVVPNLWGGINAPPGFLKSPTIEQALRPLYRLAREAHDAYEAEAAYRDAEAEYFAIQIASAKEELKRATKSGDKRGIEVAINQIAEAKRSADSQPRERRYFTSDATIEKLGELLRDNPRGILLVRDELAGWMLGMERDARKSEREFYLEAWGGTGSHTVDRIGRGTIHIPNMCVSIFGSIQPGKLGRWVRGAVRGEEQADGLLQRLQVLVWPEQLGEWRKVTTWPDSGARDRAYEIFKALDRLPTEAEGGEIPSVHFNDGGQELFDQWRRELERRTRSAELVNTPAFAAHLGKYRSLMPSLALLFGLIRARGEVAGFKADQEDAALAADWCDFLEAHAVKVYASEMDPDADAAHSLAAKIRAGAVVDEIPVRDIYRSHWSGLATEDDVDGAIDGLEQAGWVRREQRQTGGRPTVLLRLHPQLRGRGA